MTLLKDNNYKDINIALLSLENDIKNKLANFDNSVINAQLEEINKRIDEINANANDNASINDSSAEINDIRTEIENINTEINTINSNIDNIEQQLSNVFLAENFVEDFNTTIEPGVYYWTDSSQNRPTNYGVLLVNRYKTTSNWINQIAYSTDGKICFRQKINDNGWRAWSTIAYEDITKTYTIPDVTAPTTRYIKLGTFPWHFAETVKVKLSGANLEDTVEFNVLGGNGNAASVNGWYTTNSGQTKDIRVVQTTPGSFASNIEVWLRVGQFANLTVKLTGNAIAAQYFNSNPQMNNTTTAPSGTSVTITFDSSRGMFGQNFEGTARSAKGWQEYALDLKSLSNSNFYPVVIDTSYKFAEVEIYSEPVSESLPYNQNRIKFAISAAGWSDTPKSLYISEYNRYQSNEITIGSIGYCTDTDYKAVIWLRGGIYYNCYTMNCASAPSIKTVDTALNTSVVTVGTSYSGGTNTKVNIIFTPETMSRGIYAYNGITTPSNLAIKNNNSATLTNYGKEPLSIGDASGKNIGIDGDDIQARNNGAASTLDFNYYGGMVRVNGQDTGAGGLTIKGHLNIPTSAPSNPVKGDIWLVL